MGTAVVPPLCARKRVMRCRCSPGHLLFVAVLGTAALLTRFADGYAWCQEYWNWDGKRHSSADGRRWPANDGVVITYINGIFHSVPEWESITHQLQTIFGHEVRPFYNPSSGWWITDASKAGYHLLRKPANDTIAQALGQHLAQAVDDVGRGRVLHIAHSGGALITYLAAQHHLTRRQRDKIDVLTFGGARSITRKYFSGRVVNYYARNDPLVKLDRRAAELMKLTNNTKFQEINEKHNTTFIFLEGRARQFVLDHSLEGPTYQHALRKEARAFRRAHFGPLSPLSWDYEKSLLRLARKKVAQLSGLHDFFNTERFGLRSLRKSVAHLTGFHGFFSGKNPGAKGVAVSVVGRERRGSTAAATAEEEEAKEAAGARWWWPWGRRQAGSGGEGEGVGDLTATAAPAAPGADGAEAPGGGDRFWLGFRWSRRRKQRQDEEQEEAVGGVSDLAAPPLLIPEGAAGGDGGESLPRSRWAQVRGALGFARPAEPEAVDAAAVPEAQSDSSEEEGEVEAEEDPELTAASPERSSRPWLSVGWTPWGGRMKDGSSDVPSTPGKEGGGGAGEAVGGTAVDEGDGDVASTAPPSPAASTSASTDVAIGNTEDQRRVSSTADESPPPAVGSPAGAEEAASPSRDDVSYLRRWWPGATSSSSSSSVAQGATGEANGDVLKGPEKGKRAETEDGTSGGEEAGGGEVEPPPEVTEPPISEPGGIWQDDAEDGEGQPKSPSLLRRWWPTSKDEPTSPAPGEEGDRSLDATQVDGGGVRASLSEVGSVGSEDGDPAEGLENGGTDNLPESPPEAELPRLSSVQEEEEGKEAEHQEEALPASTSGVREDMSAGQAAASFAQRFWEVFSNKPAALPLPDESTSAAASDLDGPSDSSDEHPEDTAEDVEKVEQTGAVEGAREDDDDADSQEAESIVGEVIVAEDFLRPSVDADAGDAPSPPSAETTETEVEKEDEARGVEDVRGRVKEEDGGPKQGLAPVENADGQDAGPEEALAPAENADGRNDNDEALKDESGERGDGDGGGEEVEEDGDGGPRPGLSAGDAEESDEGVEEHGLEEPEIQGKESDPATPATPAKAVRERVSGSAVTEVETPQQR